MRTAALALCLILASCSKGAATNKGKGDVAATGHGALVARVGQVEIRQEDVERAMARDPGASPARFNGPRARRELIDGLVRFELLVQAADRAGFTKDPDAIHALQQIAVTKLVNQALGAAGSPDSIGRADIEREYAARRASDFTRHTPSGDVVSPLDSVAEVIRQRLYRERRARALDELVAKLRRETPVEIVEQQVARNDSQK